jgi:hypothetical protein
MAWNKVGSQLVQSFAELMVCPSGLNVASGKGAAYALSAASRAWHTRSIIREPPVSSRSLSKTFYAIGAQIAPSFDASGAQRTEGSAGPIGALQ